MSIDHVGIGGIKDINGTRNFYEQALGPLGYKVQMEYPGLAIGFGASPYKPDFWIASGSNQQYGDDIIATSGAHIAFKGSRAQVHAFHEAALQGVLPYNHKASQRVEHNIGSSSWRKCNGPPGFRYYHPFYYAAFVLDPNGNNIEVVNHGSAWQWIWYLIGTKLGLVAKHEKKD